MKQLLKMLKVQYSFFEKKRNAILMSNVLSKRFSAKDYEVFNVHFLSFSLIL